MSALFRSLLMVALWASTSAARAAPAYEPVADYTFSLPYSPTSFSSSASAFPITTQRVLEGYPLASRLLAATGNDVFLQTAFGTPDWLPVAHTDPEEGSMDPCFLRITPNGERIALGTGLEQPLYVFPAALLSLETPPILRATPGVRSYQLSYYDAAWRDDRYLFLNAGTSTGSAIFVVDTESEGPDAIRIAIDAIPGASGGVAFDRQGNLITGNGYDYGPDGSHTGELRIFSAADIASVLTGTPLAYTTDGIVLADNVLSAAFLKVDADNNLLVGGGDAFGSTGNKGYAAVIDHLVLSRVLSGGSPLNPAMPGELQVVAPDPCKNDDATNVLYIDGINLLLVSANMSTQPPECADLDWSGSGPPPFHAYFPPDPPDEDADGIPDGVDADFSQRIVTGRGELAHFMSAFGSSRGDTHYDAQLDSDGDGTIGWADYEALLARWGKP
jgi:hypothetical protein